MNKSEDFTYQRVTYEIRSLLVKDGYGAAAFHDGRQISPTFTITRETHTDYAVYHGERGLDALFRIIKQEISDGRIGIK